MTKKCYVCGNIKNASEFSTHRGRPDGLRAECKACTKVLSDKWARENKEYLQLFRRKYFIQSGYNQKDRRDIAGIIKRDYPEDGYCEICHKNNKRLAYHHWSEDFPSWGIWMCAGCHVGCNFLEKLDLSEKYWKLRKKIELEYNPDVSNAPRNVGELKKHSKIMK